MKIVLDTNVIVSGLLFGGKPLQILESVAEGKIEAYTSEVLVEELLGILDEKFNLSRDRLAEIEESIRENFEVINPKVVVNAARDTDDNAVLAVALEAGVDYLITGDNDLLVLKHAGGKIPIVGPEQVLRQLNFE